MVEHARRHVSRPGADGSALPAGAGRLLIVEDEPDVTQLLRYNLAKEGYEVLTAATGGEAVRLARDVLPDVVLLDIMIPELNGWEVCRRLKSVPATQVIPIIMVTGRVEEGDKVLGFELGADDYVTKPFSPRELIARVRAIVRRTQRPTNPDRKAPITAGGLEIDRERFEVRMDGALLELTRKEFDLLVTLVGSPGRVFSRDELLDLVWGRDGNVEPRTVDVHVARLRGKFTAAGVSAPGVDSVRGVGYRFKDPVPPR